MRPVRTPRVTPSRSRRAPHSLGLRARGHPGYHGARMASHGDQELSERLFERDEEALRVVIREFGPSVHGMARKIVGEPAMAEEVAQDTFVALWNRPGAFDP